MQNDDSPEFDIQKYRDILWKRRYVALAVALGIVSILTWGSYLWPKSYEASVTVTLEKSALVNPLMQGAGVSAIEERLIDLRNTITSRPIIRRVLAKLDHDGHEKNPLYYDGLIADVQKHLQVTPIQSVGSRRTSDLFKISYRGKDPRAVFDMLEALVKEFIEESAGLQRSDAIGVYDFIDEQLSAYRKKLEDSDRAIREFREKNPTMLPQSETVMLGRIESYQTSRIEADIKLKELLRKKESLQKQLTGEKEMTVAFVTQDGSPASRMSYLHNQLMLLLTKYTEDYPEVVKVKSEIDQLQKQIERGDKESSAPNAAGSEMKAANPVYRQIKEELSKTETEIESIRARHEELTKLQNEGRVSLGRMPKEQEEWSKLQRDRSAYQRVYDELIQKRESARLTKNLETEDKTTRLRMVDPPVLPRIPVSPDRVKIILLGLVFGIVAGAGAAIGLDYLDNTFKDEDSVQKGLHVPVLASIPTIITDGDVLAESARDKKVFTAAVAYLSLIGLLLVVEIAFRYFGIAIFRS